MDNQNPLRRLLTLTQVKKAIQAARNVPGESFVDYKMVTLFQTPSISSTLLATKDSVYKILDKADKKDILVNWKVPKEAFLNSLSKSQVVVKKGTGKIRFSHNPDKFYRFDPFFFKKDLREVIPKLLGL